MRELKAKDIAPFTKILTKMELKSELKDIFSSVRDGNTNYTEIGTDVIYIIIENYHKAQDEFFAFIAGLGEKTPEEIAELPLVQFIPLLEELFSEKNFPFFKLAAK